MVAPAYFASAAALTLSAVVPVSGVSPAWPLSVDDVPLTEVVAAEAAPVVARNAPPPKPTSTRAPPAMSFFARACILLPFFLITGTGKRRAGGSGRPRV